MLGMTRLTVFVAKETWTVKVSVIYTIASYNAILGKPSHSFDLSPEVIPLTYHQCIKFPSYDIQIQTLPGNQRAARNLMAAKVKLGKTASLVNTEAKPIQKIDLVEGGSYQGLHL